jgi:hypothetical protein
MGIEGYKVIMLSILYYHNMGIFQEYVLIWMLMIVQRPSLLFQRHGMGCTLSAKAMMLESYEVNSSIFYKEKNGFNFIGKVGVNWKIY